jgi:hypothetical protein
MGVISSFEFVPRDFKIKYVDSLVRPQMSIQYGNSIWRSKLSFKVMFAKDIIEKFK